MASRAVPRGRPGGWPYRFVPTPWAEMSAFLDAVADVNPTHRHLAAIAASVRAGGQETNLAGLTSMHDLIVRSRPLSDPPVDVVAVRSPSSLVHVPAGMVVIEHLSTTGHDDRIMRPVDEAVPLFWRFMAEKFDLLPVVGTDRSGGRRSKG